MGDLVRIVGLAVIVSVLFAFLRKETPVFGMLAAMSFVALVLLLMIEPIRRIIDVFAELATEASIRNVYLTLVLKAVGIAYITSIGAELCRDAGEQGVGTAVELAGKVYILLLAVPVVTAILDVLVRLLP